MYRHLPVSIFVVHWQEAFECFLESQELREDVLGERSAAAAPSLAGLAAVALHLQVFRSRTLRV